MSVAYLLRLLGAAALKPAPAPPQAAATWRWLVLVPAHDEEPVIGDTLRALEALEPTAGGHRVVVVADHCTDRTVEVARATGAEVLDRTDGPRGKGSALAWALDGLLARDDAPDAVLVFDADCRPTPNLLVALERRMRAGAPAAQADYVVANPDGGPAAALRFAAFRLINTVRPMGKQALGRSAGLRGTGMAFTRELLERHPFRTTSLVEDHEFHFDLVASGERVAFCAEAAVHSDMPTTMRATGDQQLRWESGRSVLLRRYGPGFARRALRGDREAADAAADLLVPPQSLLLAGSAAVLVVATAARARAARTLSALSLAGQVVYVLGGLRLTGAPSSVYRALLRVPLLVTQRLWLSARMLTGRGASGWVRTDRAPAA